MSARLFLSNLPPDCGESELRTLFSKCGHVQEVEIRRGKEASFAVIRMSNAAEARAAVQELDEHSLRGRKLKIV
jgi:RNA recognition motif-containing protein